MQSFFFFFFFFFLRDFIFKKTLFEKLQYLKQDAKLCSYYWDLTLNLTCKISLFFLYQILFQVIKELNDKEIAEELKSISFLYINHLRKLQVIKLNATLAWISGKRRLLKLEISWWCAFHVHFTIIDWCAFHHNFMLYRKLISEYC